MGHSGCITAKESSPGWIQARHIWVPNGTLVLYILSLRRLSLCDYCAGFFGQFVVFLWKWKLLVLLPEPKQPSLFDTSLVALALFSELCPCVCYKSLFIFPLICVGQGEQHLDFTKVCNTLQLAQDNTALDNSKKTSRLYFHLPPIPAFQIQGRQQKASSKGWSASKTTQFLPAMEGCF